MTHLIEDGMPVSDSRKKGDVLEDAVRAIEDTILRTAPGYAEGTFKIQGKRIVSKDGVRHEIDVFVTASLPGGYEATFIFECKNWEARVGKNELIIFSEKIAAVGAQRGFFVAKAFTRDARAQAAKDSRLELLTASNIEPVTRVEFPQIQLVHINDTTANVQFAGFGDGSFPNEVPITLEGETITIAAVKQPAAEYVSQLIIAARDGCVNRVSPASLSEGDHKVEFSDRLTFESGEAFLGEKSLRSIVVRGVADVSVARGSVLSVFDVHTRGRVLQVGVESHGITMQATLVEINR